MIINEQQKDMIIVGEDTSKKATISADKMAKLQYLLTKGLYKDPITAVIAEWTNNGVDSIVQAGKDPKENPVIVQITKNEKGQYVFSVEDKGTGLDKDDFENICMNYLESTKEGDNDTIGHFGIGMKSFLSLERTATFTCRKNGMERVYLVYEGAEFVNYDMITEKVTDEMDGVKAELIISGYSERDTFIKKAKQKLAYYDTAVLLIDGIPVANTIHRNDLFQWATLNSNSYIHLCLKDVYYQIDWEALGIPSIPMPIALRFDLGAGITPTPSRESYITNENTKQLILNRIKEVAKWFVEKYNSGIKRFDNFFDAYPHLGISSYNVVLSGTTFNINNITSHSSVRIIEPEVDGIKLRDPSFYKGRVSEFFYNYYPIVYYTDRHIWQKKHLSHISSYLFSQKDVVVVGDNFVGNVKEFLKEKYGKATLFIGKHTHKRTLDAYKWSYGSYKVELRLHDYKKEEWRGLIQEWQNVENSLSSRFKDETNCHNSADFNTWLEQKREKMRERRRLGMVSNYNTLNKQQGDVTLAYSYKSYRGISFKKKAYKISSLSSNKFLTILIKPEDDLDRAKAILQMMPQDHIKWATVGNKECKKVPETQFINFKQFMSMEYKPFMRLASAILFDNLLTEFKKIKQYKEGIFQNCLSSCLVAEKRLELYVRENYLDTGDEEVAQYILKVAESKDLFDKILWSEYLYLKEGVSKYDWITCLDEPASWDNEAKKKYQKVITQILLFRKKYYNEFPENARIVFDEPKEEDKTEEGEFDEEGEVVEDDFDEIELETI